MLRDTTFFDGESRVRKDNRQWPLFGHHIRWARTFSSNHSGMTGKNIESQCRIRSTWFPDTSVNRKCRTHQLNASARYRTVRPFRPHPSQQEPMPVIIFGRLIRRCCEIRQTLFTDNSHGYWRLLMRRVEIRKLAESLLQEKTLTMSKLNSAASPGDTIYPVNSSTIWLNSTMLWQRERFRKLQSILNAIKKISNNMMFWSAKAHEISKGLRNWWSQLIGTKGMESV